MEITKGRYIILTVDFTGNCGNQMWQYTITRVVAEYNGYEWGFNKHPSHDYFGGQEQMDFMEMDYGKEHDTPFGQLPPGIDKLWVEPKEVHDGYNFHPYAPEIFDIADGTKLVIECGQNENYIKDRKEDIRKWFAIKQGYQQDTFSLDEDTCIINVRGGYEYLHLPTVLLRQEYWHDAIAHMKIKNPNMKFVVVTDDVTYAKTILPYPAHHFSIGTDYWTINQAYNLILSNSSFALFPAWLNRNARFIIAPKYWARHNVSHGEWASSDVRMEGWKYLDRDGKLYDN